jgi:hypothetical protein
MNKAQENAQKSLYISLFVVAIFLLGIFATQFPKYSANTAQSDSVYAGVEEPVDSTVPPIGGSDEATNAPATATPTTRATTVASSSATPVPTIRPTVGPTLPSEPTPVPTFELNLPGETTENATPSPAPVANVQSNSNIPIIIGIIVGLLLIGGGVALVIARRASKANEIIPSGNPVPPPSQFTPPVKQDPNTYVTPYDQYMNNQPGNDQNK